MIGGGQLPPKQHRGNQMSRKEDIYYESRDGRTKIHGVIWKPDCMLKEQPENPRLVLQIVHGMEEYIDRYDEFAQFMNKQGICVIGNDHLGHGQSVSDEVVHGYFGMEDIATVVVRDVHRLKKIVQKELPDVPFFIMGHSMGSFITRNYICRYGSGIRGAVIMGTGYQPAVVLGLGKFVARTLALFHGWEYKSPLLQKMAFGAYQKRIEKPLTDTDWLSVNADNVKRYNEDPLCGFGFTVNGFYTLFEFVKRAQSASWRKQIPKELPMFFVAGTEDPVGNYGEGVKKAYALYEKAGIRDLCIKLYDEDRHEILNEDDREQIAQDIYEWIDRHMRTEKETESTT